MPFNPEDQQIYRYCDGSRDAEGRFRVRRGDPIAIYSKLMAAVGGFDAFLKMWNSAMTEGPQRDEHEVNLVRVIQHAFDLKPLDPYEAEGAHTGGLGRSATIETLHDFFNWQKKSARNIVGSPNTSRPTRDFRSHSTISATRPMSDSGLTGTASNPSRQSPTYEQSTSPTEPIQTVG